MKKYTDDFGLEHEDKQLTFKEHFKDFWKVILLGLLGIFIIAFASYFVSATTVNNAGYYYALDVNSTTQIDSSGNSNTGTGTSLYLFNTSCKTGNCSTLITNGAEINATSTSTNDVTQNFSISLWVKTGVATNSFIWKGLGSGNNLQLGELGGKIYSYTKTGTHGCEYNTGSSLPLNNWTHIVVRYVTYTGSQQNIETWINGVADGNLTCSDGLSGGSKTNSNNVVLGGTCPAGTGAANVTIDEVGFYQYLLNSSQIAELSTGANPYNVSGVVLNNITFINQSPSTITTTNIIGSYLNITYSINNSGKINTSPYLWSNLSNATTYVNGSVFSMQLNTSYNQTNNTQYSFLLDDNDIYPATYNVNEDLMENTTHNTWTTSTSNNMVKVELLNVSTSSSYNIFEVMADVNSTGTSRIYYCNSSYSTGNPSVNSNCVQFASLNSTGFNHSHGQGLSKHNAFSMPFISGTLGGVNVTSTSYFILDKGTANILQVSYINGSPRVNASMTTTNNGNVWSNQAWTVDLHVHQYNSNEALNYKMCYNITSTLSECSNLSTKYYTQSALPPTSPVVTINTTNPYYLDTVFVSFTNSTPSNSSITITNYNVTIRDTSQNLLFVVNNSASYNTSFKANNLLYGTDYVVRVTATDSLGNVAYGNSNVFNVYGRILSPCNESIVMNSTGVPVYFSYINDSGATRTYIMGRYGLYPEVVLANATNTSFLLTGLNGNYTLSINSTYALLDTSQNTSCWLSSCVNSYVQNTAGCVGNTRYITYTDINHCSLQYDVPSNNGTYEDCVTPANTDKELWLLVVLFILLITLIILGVFFPYVFIGALFVSVFVTIQFLSYFTTAPIIVGLMFPFIVVVIGGLSIIGRR